MHETSAYTDQRGCGHIYTHDEYHVRAGYMLLIQLRGMYYAEWQ